MGIPILRDLRRAMTPAVATVIVLLLLSSCLSLFAQPAPSNQETQPGAPAQSSEGPQLQRGAPVVLHGETLFVIHSDLGPYPADYRVLR